MNPVLVNVATNGRYPQCQETLVKSFMSNGYDGEYLLFKNDWPPNCPPHGCNHQYDPDSNSVPYAFKAYAMHQAWEKGYDLIIWCDSVYQLLRPIRELYESIINPGYALMWGGWKLGEWCADSALDPLGTTREEVMQMNQIHAAVMCFDMTKDVCKQFMEQYYWHAKDGRAYKGSWTNTNGEASSDPRVLGHRHDQTVASFIAQKLDMTEWKSGYMAFNRDQVKEGTMFLAC